MQRSPLLNHISERAQLWIEDAKQLREAGKEKQCEKCLVAAEVYEECSAQLQDILKSII